MGGTNDQFRGARGMNSQIPRERGMNDHFRAAAHIFNYLNYLDCCVFLACFLPRRAEEKKQKTGVPTYLPFLRFFEIFRSDFRKYLYGVFGLLMQRNGQKRDKKKSMGKDDRKKVFFSQLFPAKSF
jgi:hypothetical protein